jgi:phage-related holin
VDAFEILSPTGRGPSPLEGEESMKHPWRFWITAFVLAAGFDLLFWGKSIGISFLIWVVLALAGAIFLSISENKRPAAGSWVLGAICIVLAGISFLRQEPFTRIAAVLLSLACLGILAATFSTGHWLVYTLPQAVVSTARTFWAGLSRATRLTVDVARSQTPDENGKRSIWKSAGPVLRGLLLATPVVIVLGALLASADMVFARSLEQFFKWFNISNWGEFIFRLFYVLVFTYVFTGLYLHAVQPIYTEANLTEKKALIPPFLGHIEAFIVLVSVDLLFVIFVIIQFAYLFGGQANIHELGFTYSDYARRGFSELVVVAGLSFLLYFVLAGVTRIETPSRRKVFTGLSVGLMALVVVILASALDRLLLYEGAYGFTRVRTYTHVLIIWMAVALLVTVILELIGRRNFLPQTFLLTGLCFVLSLGVLNVDGYIVRQNVQRSVGSIELDTEYLRNLSNDAVPELFTQFDKPGISAEIHDELGAELSCRAYALSKADPQPWQSFNWASYRTQSLLKQHQTALQPYQVSKNSSNSYLSVQLQNRKYFCTLYDSD